MLHQRSLPSLIARSLRFGAAVTLSAFAVAIVAAVSIHLDRSPPATASAMAMGESGVASRGSAEAPGDRLLPPLTATRRATPAGGDERAVFEPEPPPESTVVPEAVATSAAVVRQPVAAVAPAPPPAPTPAPPAAAPPPEPRVYASHATVYDAVAAAFPEQADRAYAVVLCESSGHAGARSGTGYYGLWQFDLPTWQSVGGSGLPSEASVDEQVRRARMLYDSRGWAPWSCA
jgi:hypothetical protein